MLFSTEIHGTATALINEHVNVPLIGEGQEAKLFRRALETIDEQIEGALRERFGAEAVQLIADLFDPSKGAEAKGTKIAGLLATVANEKIDLPFIDEKAEGALFNQVLSAIGTAAAQALSGALSQQVVSD